MMQLWENLEIKFPEAMPAIQDGLKKLKTYRDRTEVVPAYTLATILNPNTKLHWFNRYAPEDEADAKSLFMEKLREYCQIAAVPPTTARPQAKGHTNWADDLLSDNLFDTTVHPQSLEAEVQAYLSDVKCGNDIVKYWQDEEIVTLEARMTANDDVPDDIAAFIEQLRSEK
ncbi:hypothetical protein IW262DRAFT_1302046 [Armillaria fumosa]|nr:hypothetical protein IW262DRAFT_1302046 [Armillaria fumosa]